MIRHPMHGPVVRLALAPGRAMRVAAALLLFTTQLAGCYATRPVEGAPDHGSTVILELNDRGRLALADRVGASAERIQGQLESFTDSAFVLRVQSVRYIDGQMNQWSGEQIILPKDYVSRARQQEFSRSRTLLLTAGIAAMIIALALQLDLVGGGSDAPGGEPSKGGTPTS